MSAKEWNWRAWPRIQGGRPQGDVLNPTAEKVECPSDKTLIKLDSASLSGLYSYLCISTDYLSSALCCCFFFFNFVTWNENEQYVLGSSTRKKIPWATHRSLLHGLCFIFTISFASVTTDMDHSRACAQISTIHTRNLLPITFWIRKAFQRLYSFTFVPVHVSHRKSLHVLYSSVMHCIFPVT